MNCSWHKLGAYLNLVDKDTIVLSYEQIIKITDSKAVKTIYSYPAFFDDHSRVVFKSIIEAGYTWKNDFNNNNVIFMKEK